MYQTYVIDPVLNQDEIAYILREVSKLDHHQEEDGHHLGRAKPHNFTRIAGRFNPFVRYGGIVDPYMVLYHLRPDIVVQEHRDRDFPGPHKTRACLSMLIPLNSGYTGGETMIGTKEAPKAAVGGALVFDHIRLHSSRPVIQGSRFVLKTDIFI